jgi:hypothetical protein
MLSTLLTFKHKHGIMKFMMHRRWRRFLPKQKLSGVVLQDGTRLSTVRSLDDANTFVTQLKAGPSDEKSDTAEHLHTQLLAQTPKAALAQIEMDKHKHGYHDREKRLYELIDFNDTFVALVLATPHDQLKTFAERLKADMTMFCRQLNTPMFSDQEYDAIVRGLAREIAVYRSARYKGFDAVMTNRTEDAFGIDMVITQPNTGKVLYIDCKTPPSFRHRLEEMVDHGKISESQLMKADADGFITSPHRRGDETVLVTLFCILPDRLGDIHDFTFDRPELLAAELNRIFETI